jgi:ribosomal protein S17
MNKQVNIGKEKKGKGCLAERLGQNPEAVSIELENSVYRVGDVVQCVSTKYL